MDTARHRYVSGLFERWPPAPAISGRSGWMTDRSDKLWNQILEMTGSESNVLDRADNFNGVQKGLKKSHKGYLRLDSRL